MSAIRRARPIAAMATALGLAGLVLAGSGVSTLATVTEERPVLIGVLTASFGPTPHVAGLEAGLKELGYRKDQDYVLGVRFTNGSLAELPEAAGSLVRGGATLLFTVSDEPTLAAIGVADGLPVVFTGVADPVGMGIIDSYARPGGNATGVADLNLELSGKRLQMFQAMVPSLRRVLVPYDAASAFQSRKLVRYREAAARLDIELIELPLFTMDEAERRLVETPHAGIDGILSPRNTNLNIPGFVLQGSIAQGLPAMFGSDFYPEHGGLASYGPSFFRSGRLAARQVDKILRGAALSEIPVEVDERLEFVVNLKTAATLGIQVPPEVLYQADRVIR